jgi:hypothetical protein
MVQAQGRPHRLAFVKRMRKTFNGDRSERGFLDHAEYVRRLGHITELGQVTHVRRGVCKTVGTAYVGSNPTPATSCGNGP